MPTLKEVTGLDASAGTATSYAVSVGDVFMGVLDGRWDIDWIRVELVEGKPYQISLTSTGDNAEADLVLRVVNSEGNEVDANDDIDFAAGNLNSQVRFFLDEPGVYYIIAESFRGNPTRQTWGAYSLVLSDREMKDAENGPGLGSEDDDVLVGSDADDELAGGKGDDWLLGGAGGDALTGGAGNDFASYSKSADGVEVSLLDGVARGGDAEGDRLVGMEIVGVLGAAGETQKLTVADIEHLVGSGHDDILEGSYAGNWLFGLNGDDELNGSDGDDRLVGGTGDDRLVGGTGDDRLVGGTGDDRLVGGMGDDMLAGNAGADILVGGEGADLLRGGAGIDVASYRDSDAGVIVRLYDGTARRGHAEGDRFTGFDVIEYLDAEGEIQQREVSDIEGLVGSDHGDVLIGDLRDNRLDGGAGNDTLRGDPGDGSGGADLLRGGPGDDRLYGGVGADVLEGGPGADHLWGGAGYDLASYRSSAAGVEIDLRDGTARGGDAEGDRFAGTEIIEYVDADNETRREDMPDIEHLIGSVHDDVLAGARGGNWLFGLEGDDELDGREGDDWLEGGAGADLIRGGAGTDVASYRDSDTGVTVRLHSGTLLGGDAEGDRFTGFDVIEYLDAEGEIQQREAPDIEDLAGSAFDDILAGDLRDNRLDGGAGNDILYGGPDGGADLLRGGPGDDRLYGGVGADALEGGPGADHLWGGAGYDFASYRSSAAGVEIDLRDGTARGGDAEGDRFAGTEIIEYVDADNETRREDMPDIEHLIGSVHDDVLAGARGGNWLFGLEGDDELDGREGDDWLEGGAGADLLRGGAGTDVASYRDSDAGVTVRLHSGTLLGGDAEGDRFTGFDVIEYLDAEGEIQRREAPDIEDLAGSAFDDILAGDLRDNRLDGGAGNDILYGGPDGGADLLRGGPGDDRLYGGVGADALEGGPGADLLRGGPGADVLYGGPGADIFVFAPGDGNDYISDFRFGDDRIGLTAFEDIRSPGDLDISEQEGDLLIDLSDQGGGQLTLHGLNEEDITADYIVFFSDDPLIMA